MERRYKVKPAKHKHQKKQETKPSLQDPVIARRLSGKLHIQEDVLAKAPILTAYGDHKLCIENYRSILEYTDNQVKVQTKTRKILIRGRHLVIAYYRDDGMCLLGDILSIEYI